MDLHVILSYLVIIIEIVFAFGLVIFFHELGHFIVAKMNGVEAPDFSLGMGPEVAGFDYRGTHYKLSLFPIGGYVRMVGEEEDEQLEVNVPRERNFRYKTPLQKIAIIFAGPFMNMVLAVLLFASISMIWGLPRDLPVPPDKISNSAFVVVLDPRLAAARAGMKVGDVILSIDGKTFTDKSETESYIQTSGGNVLDIKVLRGAREIDLKVKPKYQKGKRGKIGAKLAGTVETKPSGTEKRVIVVSVLSGSPADKAGLKSGDAIISVGEKKTAEVKEIVRYIEARSGQEIAFEIVRGDRKLEIIIKPEPKKMGEIGVYLDNPVPRLVTAVEKGSPAAAAGLKKGDVILDFQGASFEKSDYSLPAKSVVLLVYRRDAATEKVTVNGAAGAQLGAELMPPYRRVDPFSAVWFGMRQSVAITAAMYDGIMGMIRHEISADGVGGPVAIYQYATTFARQGLRELIGFFGMISITLALINLFPFPALDGSRIVFHAWEAVWRKPLDPKREGLIHYVGFCILIALIIFITFRDIRLWLGF